MYERQFLLMVDGRDADLRTLLLERLSETAPLGYRSVTYRGNEIYPHQNEDYDSIRASDPDAGFHYFRYQVEVMLIQNDPTVEEQVVLAKELSRFFEEASFKVVICADFEELL